MAPKKTITDIEGLRAALKDLKALQAQMGNGASGAYSALDGATDVSDDVGPLVNGAGTQISTYINVRADAIREAINTSGKGVAAAVKMLSDTIDNYDKHETKTKQAADGTGNGGGKGPSSEPGKGR